MSVQAATHHEEESWWSCFPKFGAEVRRNPKIVKAERDLPVVISAGEVTSKVIQSNEITLLFQAFTGTQGQSNAGWINDPKIIDLVARVRLVFGGVGVVAAIVKIVAESIEVFEETKKGRKKAQKDAMLRLSEAIIHLGDAAASFGKSLSMAGWVAQADILTWATPLAYVSAMLSPITMAINYRSKKSSEKVLNKLSRDNVEESLQWLENEIRNQRKDGEIFVQRHFQIPNREKYGAQILHIIREGSEVDKYDLIEALKHRVSDKITSHRWAIRISVISLIATAILFFPVLGPALLGLGLAIFAGVLSMIKYYRDRKSAYELEHKINHIKRFDEIPPEWIKENAQFAIPCLKPEEQHGFKGTCVELVHDPRMFQTRIELVQPVVV